MLCRYKDLILVPSTRGKPGVAVPTVVIALGRQKKDSPVTADHIVLLIQGVPSLVRYPFLTNR